MKSTFGHAVDSAAAAPVAMPKVAMQPIAISTLCRDGRMVKKGSNTEQHSTHGGGDGNDRIPDTTVQLRDRNRCSRRRP
ncbi:MAG: hypothetical protein LW698_12635 [Planctomycetaceae bacterium]|jgi:hypothetical protein|nr:hypothetical protein [Planctomycetaceae bacterium]